MSLPATASEIREAYEINAMHDLTATRRAGLHGDGWNRLRPADIPVWHMRPGMQVQGLRGGWDTVVSAPQHDADWRNEHILVRNDLSGAERVLSRPYRSFVFVSAPAWQLSSEYFTATHDSTRPTLTPAAPAATPAKVASRVSHR